MKHLIAAVFLLLTSVVSAQTAERSGGETLSAGSLLGHWLGTWQGQRNDGEMELKIQSIDADRMTGQMRATFRYRSNCSTAWENLGGLKKTDKAVVHYDLGGSCGKIEATVSVDGNRVMSGIWVNEHGITGPLRLTKQ